MGDFVDWPSLSFDIVVVWLILFCLIAGAIISFVGESVRVPSMAVLLMLLLFVCIMCPDDY